MAEAAARLDVPAPTPPPAAVGEEERTCRGVFMEFMTKVARFEELAESGERLLVRFHQELVHSCEDGLKDHINKVSDSHSIKNKLTTESCIIGEDKSADQLDSDVLLVTVMVIVRNMLKLDYTMQEIIVGALSINMLPLELEGYCLMWDLRPYIDDDMMHLALEMCP
ncbi:hypothetical protein PAHAL_3G278800 [Panicum hallii]|uniref:DUF7795 domain-containing protein n=1 Tax=Panicum hallii TaxID=206008 RepID=A0A2T8KJK7_9POAL|nr:hypothetical protein PAHAL_3G278800 [Panicum hallii]